MSTLPTFSGKWTAGVLPIWLGVGLMLRLAAVPTAGIYHPDELFQYLEQAFRLLHHVGVVPWEYRDGVRNWLLPLAIEPWMALGERLAPATQLYLYLPRAAAAALSLTIVWSAWAYGRRRSPLHAALAAAATAISADLVFMAPHLLTEAVSTSLIMPAAALIACRRGTCSILLAGMLLGVATLLRIQHLPVAMLLALSGLAGDRRNAAPLLAGGLAALLIAVAVDIHMGMRPLGWAIGYVHENLVLGRAAQFGTEPAASYLNAITATFGLWTLPVLLLARLGARHEPLLCLAGLLNLLVHMAVGHKEFRFIWLTLVIIVMLAALGTGDLVRMMGERWPGAARRMPWIAIGLWVTASASLAAGGHEERFASRNAAGIALFTQIGMDPSRCGVALAGVHWSGTGGYTALRRPLPLFIYAPGQTGPLWHDVKGFDTIVARQATTLPASFHLERCVEASAGEPSLCLFRRPGHCAAIRSEAEINRAMVRWRQ